MNDVAAPSRRLRRLPIDPYALCAILKGGCTVIRNHLPADATARMISYDPINNDCWLFVESSDYAPVHPGQSVPAIDINEYPVFHQADAGDIPPLYMKMPADETG